MGVHDTDKYPEVKRLLGIPEDEPIFILRAQDQCSVLSVFDYAFRYQRAVEADGDRMNQEQRDFHAEVIDVHSQMDEWQLAHPSKVKIPD